MPASILTDAEIEALRFHLGWGNIGIGGYPTTPDGWLEAFRDVVAVYLTTGAETTVTASIAAAGSATCTPASMTSISANARLVVDVGDAAETVVVRAVTATTFTAVFAAAHPGPFPVAVESGLTRMRGLLHKATVANDALTGSTITQSAGLKSVGQGEVEWFGASATRDAISAHLLAIRRQISDLVRIPMRDDECGRVTALETY
jgi:hypothetical protein